MLFPTIRFALFFALVLPASWLLMPRLGRWRAFIVVASFVFYASWNIHYVWLLAASIVGNELAAVAIDRTATDQGRRRVTIGAVVANLAVLGWFKYAGFLSSSGTSALGWVGVDWRLPVPNVLLPVGISFFTFQALSYVIDVSRRHLRPVPLLEFAAYLSFFPHLVAGPIVRASEFLPQLKVRRDPRHVDAGLAFWLLGLGLFKKVVVASYLADKAVDPLFGFPQQHGGFEALVGIYAYAIQIYADFSGYTDMAIGLALLLGFRFPANFDAPYTAASLQEFWRRWHMTLSRWLRDYLYIPLGGNRRSRRRTYLNLGLTMVLGGLWHGAAWTFVVWGALHGAGLAVERLWAARPTGPVEPVLAPEVAARVGVAITWPAPLPAVDAPALVAVAAGASNVPAWVADGPDAASVATIDGDRDGASTEAGAPDDLDGSTDTADDDGVVAPGSASEPGGEDVFDQQGADRVGSRRIWLRRLAVFHLVCVAWVFFRATSLDHAFDVLGRVLFHGSSVPLNPVVVLVVAASLAAQFVPLKVVRRWQARFAGWTLARQVAAIAVVLLVVDVLGPTGVAPYIYFQF